MIIFRSTRADIRLLFLGDLSEIADDVKRIIREMSNHVTGRDYDVTLIHNFIIDISSTIPDGYSTPKPPPTGNSYLKVGTCQ